MLPNSHQVADAMVGSLVSIRRAPLPPGCRILDFGCGRGDLVRELVDRGFDAHGVDVKTFWPDDLGGRLSTIAAAYRFPYDDEAFDVVMSTSVFEHVLDYEQAFGEIHRVTKHGGDSLHLFPGPWALPVEPHMYVPLASVIHNRWWLGLWALLGVRNEFQRGPRWREVMKRNSEYCRTGINYVPRKEVRTLVERMFGTFYYAKREYIANFSGGAARLARKTRLPFMGDMIFSWREQLIHARKAH
jgi:SAM-dependent methyltransferase